MMLCPQLLRWQKGKSQIHILPKPYLFLTRETLTNKQTAKTSMSDMPKGGERIFSCALLKAKETRERHRTCLKDQSTFSGAIVVAFLPGESSPGGRALWALAFSFSLLCPYHSLSWELNGPSRRKSHSQAGLSITAPHSADQ